MKKFVLMAVALSLFLVACTTMESQTYIVDFSNEPLIIDGVVRNKSLSFEGEVYAESIYKVLTTEVWVEVTGNLSGGEPGEKFDVFFTHDRYPTKYLLNCTGNVFNPYGKAQVNCSGGYESMYPDRPDEVGSIVFETKEALMRVNIN